MFHTAYFDSGFVFDMAIISMLFYLRYRGYEKDRVLVTSDAFFLRYDLRYRGHEEGLALVTSDACFLRNDLSFPIR